MCICVSTLLSTSPSSYFRRPVDCLIEIYIVFQHNILTVLIGGVTASPATALPSTHASSKQVLKNGLKIIHISLLSPSPIEPSESASHVTKNILILESLKGVVLSGASLIIISAFILIGKCFVCAA